MAIVCKLRKYEEVGFRNHQAVGRKTLALWVSIVVLMVAFAGFSAALLFSPAVPAAPVSTAPTSLP